MHRFGKYAVAALVVVALLSVAAHEAKSRTVEDFDATACADGTLAVSAFDGDASKNETVTYADLSTGVREAFDRARSNGGSTDIDPDALSGTRLLFQFPDGGQIRASVAIVDVDGDRYLVDAETSTCPSIAGTPRWADHVVDPLLTIHRVFSPLYLPFGALLLLVVTSRKATEWLRFG